MDKLALTILIIGGLNWGLMGRFYAFSQECYGGRGIASGSADKLSRDFLRNLGIFRLYRFQHIVPPPTTVSPLYSTTACPAEIALCGSAKRIVTVPSAFASATAVASFA